MHTLILMLSMLGPQTDRAWMDSARTYGDELWRQRGAAWRVAVKSVAGLPAGAPDYVVECALFGPQQPVVENVQPPTFVFTTVTSTVHVSEAQSLIHPVMPRIIIQEEEEEKLGLVIPDEAPVRR